MIEKVPTMKNRSGFLISGTTLCLVLLLGNIPPTYAAPENLASWLLTLERRKEVKPVTDTSYNEECGSCHFAYQPGLLPAASWQQLLTRQALEKHFGENAELDEQVRLHILAIALENSADKSYYKRSKKIMVSLQKDEVPLRITKVRYFKDKHEEVYEEVVKASKKIKSMSLCDECHQKAKQGIFDDDTVVIPDHGRWTW